MRVIAQGQNYKEEYYTMLIDTDCLRSWRPFFHELLSLAWLTKSPLTRSSVDEQNSMQYKLLRIFINRTCQPVLGWNQQDF